MSTNDQDMAAMAAMNVTGGAPPEPGQPEPGPPVKSTPLGPVGHEAYLMDQVDRLLADLRFLQQGADRSDAGSRQLSIAITDLEEVKLRLWAALHPHLVGLAPREGFA